MSKSKSFLFHLWSQSQVLIFGIYFDRSCLTTVNSLLRALRAIYNISSDVFVGELLVCRRSTARPTVEEQANKKQERKLKDCFGW